MVDVHSPPKPIAISLPTDLIAELQRLAQDKNMPLDDLVREACLGYVEPYIWERCYKDWRRTHPDETPAEGIWDGKDSTLPPKMKEPA